MRYFIADRYVEAFKTLANSPNSKLVVVPMEATALAGGITQALMLLQPGAVTPGGAAAVSALRSGSVPTAGA